MNKFRYYWQQFLDNPSTMFRRGPDGDHNTVTGSTSEHTELAKAVLKHSIMEDRFDLQSTDYRNLDSVLGVLDTLQDMNMLRRTDFPETHRMGVLSVENAVEIEVELDSAKASRSSIDFGVQISRDGRVWVCINGIAWLRFKPDR